MQAELEERFRGLVEAIPDAVIIQRLGQITYANPAAARLLGADHLDQLTGRCLVSIFEEASYHRVVLEVLEADRSPLPVLVRMPRLDGGVVLGEVVPVPISFSGRPATLFFIRDLSRRGEGQAALWESEARYRSLFESSPAALLQLDLKRVAAWLEDLRREGVEDLAPHLEGRPELVREAVGLIEVAAANQAAVALLEARAEADLLGRLDPDRFSPAALGSMVEHLVARWEGRERLDTTMPVTTLKGNLIPCRVRWVVPRVLGREMLDRAILAVDELPTGST